MIGLASYRAMMYTNDAQTVHTCQTRSVCKPPPPAYIRGSACIQGLASISTITSDPGLYSRPGLYSMKNGRHVIYAGLKLEVSLTQKRLCSSEHLTACIDL